MSNNLQIVKELELSLLTPEIRQSADRLDQFIDSDFIEITGSGKIFDKKHMLEDLPKMVVPEFQVKSFETKELSPNIIQTMFTVSKVLNGETTETVRTSIWRKTGENWRMFFHQGTTIK